MLLWITATFTAFFVKGLCGFANTLVFTSVMSFGTGNASISPVELLLGYPTNLILAWKNRKQLNRRIWLPLSALVLAGSIPGALLLKHTDSRLIKTVFGIAVILIALEMLLRNHLRLKECRLLLPVIGVLSGLLCGLYGIGALLAAYVGRVTETGSGFKANLSAVFIVENTIRLFVYAALGLITPASLMRAASLAPVMLLGLLAGMKSAGLLSDRIVRTIVILLLIVSGAVLIVQNIA